MERQLVLIEERGADYQLDERTREIGRRGVAAAREILRSTPGPAAAGADRAPSGHHGRRSAA